MRQWRDFITVFWGLGTVVLVLWIWIGPWPHDSWLRTPAGNALHGLQYLPRATMLQAAERCPGGHYGPDEHYGVWAQDFQFVFLGPDPELAFRELAARPERMARLYAAIGLRTLHSERADAVVSSLEADSGMIRVSSDCAMQTVPVSAVVAEIKRGVWGPRLALTRIDVH